MGQGVQQGRATREGEGARGDGRRTSGVDAAPKRRLVIAGASRVAAALAPMARLAGFAVTVSDPRPQCAERPLCDAAFGQCLDRRTPQALFAEVPIDARTAVAALAHHGDVDDPVLLTALRSPAFYVGALGGRHTRAARRERLLAGGLAAGELERLHAPIGLNIDATGPAEIAVSILAEVIQEYHASGRDVTADREVQGRPDPAACARDW